MSWKRRIRRRIDEVEIFSSVRGTQEKDKEKVRKLVSVVEEVNVEEFIQRDCNVDFLCKGMELLRLKMSTKQISRQTAWRHAGWEEYSTVVYKSLFSMLYNVNKKNQALTLDALDHCQQQRILMWPKSAPCLFSSGLLQLTLLRRSKGYILQHLDINNLTSETSTVCRTLNSCCWHKTFSQRYTLKAWQIKRFTSWCV